MIQLESLRLNKKKIINILVIFRLGGQTKIFVRNFINHEMNRSLKTAIKFLANLFFIHFLKIKQRYCLHFDLLSVYLLNNFTCFFFFKFRNRKLIFNLLD